VHVHVAFTPEEEAAARIGIVVDVIRATSSIAQALASGYERVLCCAEIAEAQALRTELGGEAVVGGERNAVVVEGFDVGASPREFARAPKASTLILTTTNGTRAILTAASISGSAAHGALLLAVYSAGLAIPFLVTALAFSRMTTAFAVVKRHYSVIMAAGGAILIAMGILILTGGFTDLNIQAQKWTSDLGINP
jgi:hypothetical protein